MKKSEIQVGGVYRAMVNGRVVPCKVNRIDEGQGFKGNTTLYHVTNLTTSRKTTFRSAMKFREVVQESHTPDAIAARLVELRDKAFPPTVAAVAPTAEQRTEAPGSLSAALKQSAAAQSAPHVIVEARAGTGKTTTLVEGLRALKGLRTSITPSPQQRAVWDQMLLSRTAKSIGFVAFNKSIAQELQARVPLGCDAMTMHSMGYRAVLKMFGKVQASEWTVKDLIAEVTKTDLKVLRKGKLVLLNATERLVSLCKQNLSPSDKDSLDRLATHYDVDLDKFRGEVFDLVPQVLDLSRTPKGKISFDDMIWLPIIHDLPLYRYDLLLVDEAQDLNRCQQALAKKAGHRLILVGDPKQAIYGFAGADSESMPRMARELSEPELVDSEGAPQKSGACGRNVGRGCTVLPLTVTRRCGKAIVAEAKRYVPDFEAHESNPAGEILEARYPGKFRDKPEIKWEDSYGPLVRDGDMVLCRCNAPLVSQCFAFIRRGMKANIQGRDVGKGLLSTVEKMNATSITDLVHKLSAWAETEIAKEQAKKFPSENRVNGIQDRLDCLLCFCENMTTVDDVTTRINDIFTDSKDRAGVRLSSIHRAKGLEARRVFILRPPGIGPREDKMQAWELDQACNLDYVSVTRAIETLVYVF